MRIAVCASSTTSSSRAVRFSRRPVTRRNPLELRHCCAGVDLNTYDGNGVWIWQDLTVINDASGMEKREGAAAEEESDPGFTRPGWLAFRTRGLWSQRPRARAWTAVSRWRPSRRT